MPNATVRADARTLPQTTIRSALLGSVLAVGAIGVALIAARAATAAEPVSEDAGLFALIDEAREIGVRVEAALGAMGEAEKRTGEMDGELYQQLWEERYDAYERV